jgi:CheY-like chemotaxis protein
MMEADMRLPRETREDLAMVRRNIALEVRLIADLLDVSRVISGKLHLEKRPAEVMRAIREAARIVGGDLDAKGQTLAIETPAAACLTFGDAARLQQVFWNLLRNASKFTPDGGHIAVRAKVVPVDHCPLVAKSCPVGLGDCPLPQAVEANGTPSGGNLIIEVTDTGDGIAPEMLPRLFAPFAQAGDGRSLGGLGLGLSICKAVVEAHGGTIAAQSDGPGKGATFTVRLPVAQCVLAVARGNALAGAEPTPATNGDGRPASPERPKAIRILLVEDHVDTAKVMSRLLMAEGHEVMVTDSVGSALAAVEQAGAKLDLLISDVGLPDGSGHELMRQLLGQGQTIPAIALSGYGTAADIAESKAAGFVEHLTKPTSPDMLAAAIQRVTSYHRLVTRGG